jgi:hypothetical protein
MLERSIVKKFNTLEDLTAAFEINFEGLKETVEKMMIFKSISGKGPSLLSKACFME